MIGVFVGFVGKPTPISGVLEDLSTRVEEDLSTGVEEDMISVERFEGTLENDVGGSVDANRISRFAKCWYAVTEVLCNACRDVNCMMVKREKCWLWCWS